MRRRAAGERIRGGANPGSSGRGCCGHGGGWKDNAAEVEPQKLIAGASIGRCALGAVGAGAAGLHFDHSRTVRDTSYALRGLVVAGVEPRTWSAVSSGASDGRRAGTCAIVFVVLGAWSPSVCLRHYGRVRRVAQPSNFAANPTRLKKRIFRKPTSCQKNARKNVDIRRRLLATTKWHKKAPQECVLYRRKKTPLS